MIDSWWPFGVLYSQHRELTYPPMTAVRHRISASDDDSIAADKLKQEVAGHQFGIFRFLVGAAPVVAQYATK